MNSELKKRILSSIVLIPFSFFLILKGSIYFNIFLLVCFLISCYEWNLMSKKIYYKLFGTLFLLFSFFSAYTLRNLDPNPLGVFVFLFVIIICISTDIGGYFFGNLLKGPKLTKISPKKTYSGTIGSFLLSILVIFLFFSFLKKNYNLDINFSYSVFFAVISLSFVSQIGDIIISYFKRLSKIKDSGKLIPGHGGLLDRIDGMLFAFPFALIIFILFY